jgi:hypothetical protein
MHAGYRRHQERVPTSTLIFAAHTAEKEQKRNECYDEMDADFGISDFSEEHFSHSTGNDAAGLTFELASSLSLLEIDSIFRCAALPEDEWQTDDRLDQSDRGFGTLRYNMQNVKPDEVFLQETKWVVRKYSLLISMIKEAVFSQQLLDEPTAIVGRYKVAFEESLAEIGIEFQPSIGITETGWDTFQKFHANTTLICVGHC